MIYTGIGSRETPDDVLLQMRTIAMRLGEAGWMLRSGHADGADYAFEEGLGNDHPGQIFLPWPSFNANLPLFGTAHLRPQYEAYAIAGKFHPAWPNLSRGARALHARNVHQIFGPDVTKPVLPNMVVCWTKDGQGGGGTGQALRIAKNHGVPIYDLAYSKAREHVLDVLESLCESS